MKKLFFNLVLFIIFAFITITVILSTIGIKTDKFNNLISKKINDTNNNVNININPKKTILGNLSANKSAVESLTNPKGKKPSLNISKKLFSEYVS